MLCMWEGEGYCVCRLNSYVGNRQQCVRRRPESRSGRRSWPRTMRNHGWQPPFHPLQASIVFGFGVVAGTGEFNYLDMKQGSY